MQLSLDQIRQVVTEASRFDHSYALQLSFILFTGCTVEESCELIWEDVHLGEQVVRFAEKKIPLNFAALRVLSDCSRQYNPYVFRFRHASQIQNRTRILARILNGGFTADTLDHSPASVSWQKSVV